MGKKKEGGVGQKQEEKKKPISTQKKKYKNKRKKEKKGAQTRFGEQNAGVIISSEGRSLLKLQHVETVGRWRSCRPGCWIIDITHCPKGEALTRSRPWKGGPLGGGEKKGEEVRITYHEVAVLGSERGVLLRGGAGGVIEKILRGPSWWRCVRKEKFFLSAEERALWEGRTEGNVFGWWKGDGTRVL